MKIPVLNINIDPTTPEGKAAIGSFLRAICAILVGMGVIKGVDEAQITAIVGGVAAVLAVIGLVSWSQKGDKKLINTKTDEVISIVADHTSPEKASVIANAVEAAKP